MNTALEVLLPYIDWLTSSGPGRPRRLEYHLVTNQADGDIIGGGKLGNDREVNIVSYASGGRLFLDQTSTGSSSGAVARMPPKYRLSSEGRGRQGFSDRFLAVAASATQFATTVPFDPAQSEEVELAIEMANLTDSVTIMLDNIIRGVRLSFEAQGDQAAGVLWGFERAIRRDGPPRAMYVLSLRRISLPV